MEILHDATKNWSQVFECKHCRSTLRLKAGDFKTKRRRVKNIDWDDVNDLLFGYTCPVCSIYNQMHWRDIPATIWELLDKQTPMLGKPAGLWQAIRRYLGLYWEAEGETHGYGDF